MLNIKKAFVCLAVMFIIFVHVFAVEAASVNDRMVAALQMLCVAAENIVSSESSIVAALEFENIVEPLDLSACGLEKTPRLKEASLAVVQEIRACGRESVAYKTMKRARDQERVKKLLADLKAQSSTDSQEWQDEPSILLLPSQTMWARPTSTKAWHAVATSLESCVLYYSNLVMELSANAVADLSKNKVQRLRAAENALLEEMRRFWSEESESDALHPTHGSLAWFHQALKEQDADKRAVMFELLEADATSFPPLLFYCGQAAFRANDMERAQAYFSRFHKIWRCPLKRDPYSLQAAKYEYILANDVLTDAQTKELARQTLANCAPDDWCERLFAAALLYSVGAKDEAVKAAEGNIYFKTETELTGVILAAMRTNTTVPQELARIAAEKRKQVEEARKAAEVAHKKLVVGNTVTFGRYNQEPIEWIVLAKENDRYLLFCENILDNMSFDDGGNSDNWAECSLRNWLNGELLKAVFSEKELSQIITVPIYSYGNMTEDKMFLLSRDEAEQYFQSDAERKSINWWLRAPAVVDTPGSIKAVSCIGDDGQIDCWPITCAGGVRPAIWVKSPLIFDPDAK